MLSELTKESTEIIVLLIAGLVCLAVLALPLLLENRKDKTNKS